MLVRRFIFDARLGSVVELGQYSVQTTTPSAAYEDALKQHRSRRDESAGQALRNAALERAERRVFAHKRYGNEHRWVE